MLPTGYGSIGNVHYKPKGFRRRVFEKRRVNVNTVIGT
jgi:hypothetical protein